MNKNIVLPQPDISQTKLRIKDHQLWLRGDTKDKKGDFSNTDFYSISRINDNYRVFQGRNLQEADFRNSNIIGYKFNGSELKGTDFRKAIFDFSQFNEK